MSASSGERVLVTLGPNAPESVHAALRAAGMKDSQVLSPQIIAGAVSPELRRALESVPGVIAVEPDEEMHAI